MCVLGKTELNDFLLLVALTVFLVINYSQNDIAINSLFTTHGGFHWRGIILWKLISLVCMIHFSYQRKSGVSSLSH